ncbi:MAG: HAMP domain-containing histidine kinase [Deltaproteobacteria bacterium]|nr:HAMP domain-containing histidine kinase [Deltaproteobacteria bacterium]
MRALAFLSEQVAEMATPANRPRLWFGIWTGFAIAIGFAGLAGLAVAADITPWRWAFVGLIAVKLVTNTLAWLSLAKGRGVLATQGLNSISDVALLTAAIYFTGGPYSPLLATYVILVTVLSLLSNLGVTLLMSGLIVVSFATMLMLMTAGVLPPTPVPGTPGGVPALGYAIISIVYCALVVGVPAWFSAATLRLLRKKEADLERRTSELIQAAAQRSQFVASMTHELRTPIHGVQGLSDVIAAGVYGPVTDKQKDACASIKRSAQTLLALVDDVLAIARADAGKLDARPSPVDVAALVDRVTASASWVVGTKDMSLEVDVPDDLPEIESDERWLAHILINLLANAVKFTPEKGTVTISARRRTGTRGDAVELAITDTGIGIAPEDRRRIFEPFRQAASGDDKGFGGVGLGLALVARLANLLAAKVELDSTVGKGSTFRVIVPVAYAGKRSTKLMRAVSPPVGLEIPPG